MYLRARAVMGTIGAIGANNAGITGMIPDGNVCYLVGKALDSNGIGFVSDILTAIDWAAQQGAHVINLSIVVSSYLQSTNQFFDDLYYNQNRIVVAAAGNSGTSDYLYPAAYSSVISVASVDEDLQSSIFSQANSRVDVAAFGRNIISTVSPTSPESLPLAIVTLPDDNNDNSPPVLMGLFSVRSAVFQERTSGPLVLCPKRGGTTPCPGPGGHFCIIERYVRSSRLHVMIGLHLHVHDSKPKPISFTLLQKQPTRLRRPSTTMPGWGWYWDHYLPSGCGPVVWRNACHQHSGNDSRRCG